MTSYLVCNGTSLSRNSSIVDIKLLSKTFMKSWSLSNFYKKLLIPTIYQFLNVVNGVSPSHKTTNKFFHLTQVHSLLTGMYA